MDEALDGIQLMHKKTEELVKRAGGKQWCALLTGLTITALVLLYLVLFF